MDKTTEPTTEQINLSELHPYEREMLLVPLFTDTYDLEEF